MNIHINAAVVRGEQESFAEKIYVARLDRAGQPFDIRRAPNMEMARAFIEVEPEFGIWTSRWRR